MPRLSVLIPCIGENGEFENTLASVLQNRPDDCEVLVVHRQAYRDPYGLQGEVCFLHVPEARSVVALLNAGFEAARSATVHVLQCGLEVEEGWSEAALACFDEENVASVAPVIVDAQTRSTVYSAGLGYSRWGRPLAGSSGKRLSANTRLSSNIIGPTLCAGFYRRRWWRLVRWDETMGDDLADVQFHLSLGRLGAATRLACGCRIHSVSPFGLAADEPFGYSTARNAERLFWMHQAAGVGTLQIAWRWPLFMAEALLALPSPRAITGFLGRIVGLMSGSDRSALQERFEQIAQLLEQERQEAEAAATVSFDQAAQPRRERMPAARKRAA